MLDSQKHLSVTAHKSRKPVSAPEDLWERLAEEVKRLTVPPAGSFNRLQFKRELGLTEWKSKQYLKNLMAISVIEPVGTYGNFCYYRRTNGKQEK